MPIIRFAKSKDDYMSLIRKFPLKKIRSNAERAHALNVSGRLIGLARKLSPGESQYLDALAILIHEYEQSHLSLNSKSATGIEVLRHVMSERQITQRGLAELLNISEGAASMLLSGTRQLTKSHIARLSAFFGISVAAFF